MENGKRGASPYTESLIDYIGIYSRVRDKDFLIVYNYRKGIEDKQEFKISEETGIITMKAFIKHCLTYKTVFNKSFICYKV